MANQKQSRVVGEHGLSGVILGPSDSSPDEVAIALADGRQVSVPPSQLTLRPEGGWFLRTANEPDREIVLPVISEELDVQKRKRTTGKVRVEKESIAHDETVSMPLTRERADVRRVVINRPVTAVPAVRREGDTIILPIVEEVPVVEKRLMLKEEIHVTRRRTTEQHEETVTVRKEQAAVRRLDAEGKPQPVESSPGVLPPEERSLLDPTKPRPSVLGPRRKSGSNSRKSLLRRD